VSAACHTFLATHDIKNVFVHVWLSDTKGRMGAVIVVPFVLDAIIIVALVM
jgi:hypothetical protein